MKKRIHRHLAILLFLPVLLGGCQAADRTGTQQAGQEEGAQKRRPEVRAAFRQKKKTDAVDDGTEKEPAGDTSMEGEKQDDSDGIVAEEGSFDYVALGNSVTCSESVGELWWGNWGMAASSEDKDYVHLLSDWLGSQMDAPVTTTVLDLKPWEVEWDRDGVLSDYKGYFNEYTDLVTIQTGENIVDFKESLGKDYLMLVKFVREAAPNAQILMLGEVLWPDEAIEDAKKAACEAFDVTFVDMAEYLTGYEESYKSFIGAKVLGADGKKHAISDEAVAAHPNDEGMACIARQVIRQIALKD